MFLWAILVTIAINLLIVIISKVAIVVFGASGWKTMHKTTGDFLGISVFLLVIVTSGIIWRAVLCRKKEDQDDEFTVHDI